MNDVNVFSLSATSLLSIPGLRVSKSLRLIFAFCIRAVHIGQSPIGEMAAMG